VPKKKKIETEQQGEHSVFLTHLCQVGNTKMPVTKTSVQMESYWWSKDA
jgi:hypothetical protein